jgi:hypothetical protein
MNQKDDKAFLINQYIANEASIDLAYMVANCLEDKTLLGNNSYRYLLDLATVYLRYYLMCYGQALSTQMSENALRVHSESILRKLLESGSTDRGTLLFSLYDLTKEEIANIGASNAR